MESNQDKTDGSHDSVNKNKKVNHIDNNQNFKYLYPYGHRMTHQMRWFKGSRNRGLSKDMAA
tara:strand:- start:167 stop:352 length:186 start_codon:yes stop_codon:yes gene_type:complete